MNEKLFTRIKQLPVVGQAAAGFYAPRGIYTFQCYGIMPNGFCACGDEECERQGKHPRTRNGFKDAICDPEEQCDLYEKNPVSNLGIPTGENQNQPFWVIDIDIDPSKGIDGELALLELEAKHGPLPKTLEQTTPRGGRHLFWSMPDFEITNANRFPRGIDVRGTGGYIVASPSIVNGVQYRFPTTPPDLSLIAEAPEWVYEYTGKATPEPGRKYPPSISPDVWELRMEPANEGGRHERITSLAAYLSSKEVHGVVLAELVYNFNEANCRPPLPDKEVYGILEWVGKQDGGYHV